MSEEEGPSSRDINDYHAVEDEYEASLFPENGKGSQCTPGQHEEDEDDSEQGAGVTLAKEASTIATTERPLVIGEVLPRSSTWVGYPLIGVAAAVGAGLVWKALQRFLTRRNEKGRHPIESLVCSKVLNIDQPSVPEHVILSKDHANLNGFPSAYTFVVSDRMNVSQYGDCSVSAPVVDIFIQRGAFCVGVVPSATDIEWIHRYLKQAKMSGWHGLGEIGVGVSLSKGICDFAIGVDEVGTTTSSVIASGYFGYRTTSGLVISEGFLDSSPTLSALCIAARDGNVLMQCSKAMNIPKAHFQDTVERYLVAEDLFSICADDVKGMLPSVIDAVKRWAGPDQAQSLSLCQWMYHRIPSIKTFMHSENMESTENGTTPSTGDILDALAGAALTIWNKEKSKTNPFYGQFPVRTYPEAIQLAEDVSIACRKAMEEGLVFVIPACSHAAPDLNASADTIMSWEKDCMRFACISSLAGIPSVIIPVKTKGNKRQKNMGVCALAKHRKDYTLLRSAGKICSFIAEGKMITKATSKTVEVSKGHEINSLGEREKNQGNKCFMAKKYDQAVQHYTNALQFDPQNPIYLSNRAMSYLKLGEYQEAEQDCTRALELDSCLVKALLRRGAARVALARFQAAKNDFERVLLLEPQNKQAREELKNVSVLS